MARISSLIGLNRQVKKLRGIYQQFRNYPAAGVFAGFAGCSGYMGAAAFLILDFRFWIGVESRWFRWRPQSKIQKSKI